MCGINGFNFSDEKIIKKMNKSIGHRGPDGEGIFVNGKISLGHRRLAIIDISQDGRQPLKYKELQIIFNGEIYNYLELKKKLEQKGYTFKTKTDTEVITAAYLEWGEKCVEKFNGMWAFVIYDPHQNILFCSRDRLGVKPFYYYWQNNKFIFSSEIKGILEHRDLKINLPKNINQEALELYFSLGYIPAPQSIFKNIVKLPAGHNLIFNLKNNNLKIKQYYFLPKMAENKNKNELIAEGKKILREAVKIRMRSDVPVGSFLSGGLDSSAVTATMANFTDLKKIHTFSVGFKGFNGKYDESHYINLVQKYLKTNHHHFYFQEKDFQALISQYAFSYDEPFADYSGFPTHFISKQAEKKVKVSLSGDGGDEIFGGYTTHILGRQMDLIYKIPAWLRKILILILNIPARWHQKIKMLKQGLETAEYSPNEFYIRATLGRGFKSKSFQNFTRQKLTKAGEYSNGSLTESLRIYDLLGNTLQDNFLVKVDRASMTYGLEVRSPFLDYRFIEFAQKIPSKWKTSFTGKSKILMREIIKDILPAEIVWRGKAGFTPPIREWIISEKYQPELEKALKILQKINPELANWYQNNAFLKDDEISATYKIRLFVFGLWYNRWVK